MLLCDTPEKVAEYWRLHVATNPYFNPECECLVVLLLTTRRRVKGHQLLTMGTMDTLLTDSRLIFRTAMVGGGAAIILAHNHPSGEAQPSEADIRVTHNLVRAGQILNIQVLDHVIIGNPHICSLRQLGHIA